MEVEAAEIRVLGALIEKQRTTPDAYPLTINALRLACNQSTNRDPVVDYDEVTVRSAAQRLAKRGWARFASGHGSRAAKYRHLLDDALRLGADELSLLAVLMLRGPPTPGELKQRTERMHRFESLAEVSETLEVLVDRELVRRLARRPGAREERYEHLVGAAAAPDGDASRTDVDAQPIAAPPVFADESLVARVDKLEAQVAEGRLLLDAN